MTNSENRHQREELLSFVQFCPDPQQRRMLHYGFVFHYLRDAVSRTGFFCETDPSWERKIQARFVTFEMMAVHGLKALMDQLDASEHVFRRVVDLKASPVTVEGRPGVLIQMPEPETQPCAFFVLPLLDVPAADFGATVQEIEDRLASAAGPPWTTFPTDPLGVYHPAGRVMFTLERTSNDPADRTGVLCYVHCDGSRVNTCRTMPADRAAFVTAVGDQVRMAGFPTPRRTQGPPPVTNPEGESGNTQGAEPAATEQTPNAESGTGSEDGLWMRFRRWMAGR